VEVLSVFLRHGKVAVTTRRRIEAAGGEVDPDPINLNIYHALLRDLTVDQAVAIFSGDIRQNPIPKPLRIDYPWGGPAPG
jgi:hypothetical protein